MMSKMGQSNLVNIYLTLRRAVAAWNFLQKINSVKSMIYTNQLIFGCFLFIDGHNSPGHFPGGQNVYNSYQYVGTLY